MTLSFADARATVIRQVSGTTQPETVPLAQSVNRVLAQDLSADRDFPALDRSVRDGFAVRASDLPGPLIVTGTVRAGDTVSELAAGQALEIMTGAPLPSGADAILMVEHVQLGRNSEGKETVSHGSVPPGTFISRRGEEAAKGQVIIASGTRLDPGHVALLAACGCVDVRVFRKPTVAILATGDELVPVEIEPLPYQVRNSNAHALAAQVERAGAIARILPTAPDDRGRTRILMEEGLSADLLLLSGGVSAGKFDFVEAALADLGALFHFDRAAIQPGAPLVFGHCKQRPFFGLPGNPASTLVTFEVFARTAIALLSGDKNTSLPVSFGRLTEPFRHKPGLTRFLPALLDREGGLTPLRWKGSSDMAAVGRANVFLIADAQRELWEAGEFLPLFWK